MNEPHPDAGHGDGGYVCPMHPEVTGTGSTACPKCGMSLVPVAEVAAGEHGHDRGHEHVGHGDAGHEHAGHDHPGHEHGTVLAKGTFNTPGQLESVLATAERRRA